MKNRVGSPPEQKGAAGLAFSEAISAASAGSEIIAHAARGRGRSSSAQTDRCRGNSPAPIHCDSISGLGRFDFAVEHFEIGRIDLDAAWFLLFGNDPFKINV